MSFFSNHEAWVAEAMAGPDADTAEIDLAEVEEAFRRACEEAADPPMVAADGSKSVGVCCCDRAFRTAAEADAHERDHLSAGW
jgi:hypothetical protein